MAVRDRVEVVDRLEPLRAAEVVDAAHVGQQLAIERRVVLEEARQHGQCLRVDAERLQVADGALGRRAAMALGRRSSSSLGLLYIDLDEFKPINDSLGHAAGDALLREVAGRLRVCVRRTDVVGRMGGDEFIVLLDSLKHDEDASIVAAKTLEALVEPFFHEGRAMRVTASIGVAIFPADGDDPDAFIAAADRAMYRAKNGGKNRYTVSPGRAATDA